MQKNIFKGFTLVELIIVITILAILSSIGFVSFQSYTSNTRDTNRLTTISNIQKGLSLYQAKNIKLPNPDDFTTIYASGVIIGYEGIVGDTVSSLIGISKTPLDPIRSENYIYYTNVNKDKSQVMGFIEGDEYKTISFLDNKITYAGKDDRSPRVEGDKLGIILDSSKQRVTGSGVDLLLTNSSSLYTSYFDNSDILTSSGKDLFSKVYNRRSDLLTNTTYASLDESLVGYWDMETLSGTKVKDLSGKGHDFYCRDVTYSNIIDCKNRTYVPGKNGGKAIKMNLDGDNYADGSSKINFSKDSNFTISTNLKFFVENVGPLVKTSYTGCQNINLLSKPNGFSFWFPCGSPPSDDNAIRMADTLGVGINAQYKDFRKDTWYNLVGIYKPGNLKFFVNGEKIYDGTSGAWTSSGTLSEPLYIMNGFSRFIVDDIRIYNRALSDSEIKQLYNSTK